MDDERPSGSPGRAACSFGGTDVADHVARAVAGAAVRAPQRSDQQIGEAIRAVRWSPTYE